MAKVKLNPVLEQIRGKVGDLVFKRYGDRVVMSRKPDFEGLEPTQAQLAQRERFREAAIYGRLVLADPGKRARYDQTAKLKENDCTTKTQLRNNRIGIRVRN